MAYSAYQYSGGILYPEHASQIVIDSSADLADINLDVVAPGTRVVDCSSGSMYILSPSKQWKLVQNDVAAAANSVVKESASGDIAVISDGADDVAVKSLVAEITPVQSGSGDPSPTNIRPISGRTGMTVTRAGKNLLSLDDATFVQFFEAEIAEIPAGTYVYSAVVTSTDTEENACAIAFLDADKETIATKVISRSVGNTRVSTRAFTVNVPIKYVRLYSSAGFPSGAGDTGTFKDNMIELGSTATDYEPYHGATYPVTWETEAGTIYGGTLDVVSGVLTVDRKYLTAKWSDFRNKTSLGDYTRGWYSVNDHAVYPPSASAPQISNIAPYKAAYSEDNLHFYVEENNVIMFLPNETDGDTDIAVCYQLATPQTYQLTPTEVRTLLGGNTIYTDAGAVSVEYVADTKLYIDNKVAELQALILEN